MPTWSARLLIGSPELSIWTQFLNWCFGRDFQPYTSGRVCCPNEKCGRNTKGGSHMLQLVSTDRILRGLSATRKRCLYKGGHAAASAQEPATSTS